MHQPLQPPNLPLAPHSLADDDCHAAQELRGGGGADLCRRQVTALLFFRRIRWSLSFFCSARLAAPWEASSEGHASQQGSCFGRLQRSLAAGPPCVMRIPLLLHLPALPLLQKIFNAFKNKDCASTSEPLAAICVGAGRWQLNSSARSILGRAGAGAAPATRVTQTCTVRRLCSGCSRNA